MSDTIIYANITGLVKVVLYKEQKSEFTFKEEVKVKKFLGITIRERKEAGYVTNFDFYDTRYKLEDLLKCDKSLYFNGVNILKKSCVKLVFKHIDTIIKYFDTYEQAETFAERFVKDNVKFEKI